MSTELFISELLFTFIILVAILIEWELIRTKNGVLRKILIAYFAIEIWVFGWSAVYWYDPFMSLGALRIVVLTPKAAIKLVWLWYLIKIRKRNLEQK